MATVYTKDSINSTIYNVIFVLLGAIMDDLTYTMDSLILTMDDIQPNTIDVSTTYVNVSIES